MEAMAMGKPLIVSGNGGLPELVEDGVNGFIYDKSMEDLAHSIEKMQNLGAEEYQSMTYASLDKAKTLFSAMGYVAELEKQVQQLKGK